MDKIILNVRFADVKFVVAVRRTQTISEAIELSKSALKSIYNSEETDSLKEQSLLFALVNDSGQPTIIPSDHTVEDVLPIITNSDIHLISRPTIPHIASNLGMPTLWNQPLLQLKTNAEWKTRVELAAAYRLFDYFGWTDLIYNHLTAAVPDEPGHILINPFGLLFSEITASSLVKINLDGEIIDPGSTSFSINKAGYVIHSAIHAARPDVKSVMHCHSTAGVAISSVKEGLLPFCQNSHIIYGYVRYHDYEGIAIRDDEKERLVADLGPRHKILILRNHGLLTCGSSIAEAFYLMFMLNRACEMQVATMAAVGGDQSRLIPVDPEIVKYSETVHANFNAEGLGYKEFNALKRLLDSKDPSYKL